MTGKRKPKPVDDGMPASVDLEVPDVAGQKRTDGSTFLTDQADADRLESAIEQIDARLDRLLDQAGEMLAWLKAAKRSPDIEAKVSAGIRCVVITRTTAAELAGLLDDAKRLGVYK